MGRVGRRFEWSNGQRSEDKWQVKGSTIKGPLDTDYSDETKFVPPTISVAARPFSKERWNKLPTVDPKIKATMNNVISMTATAFEKK